MSRAGGSGAAGNDRNAAPPPGGEHRQNTLAARLAQLWLRVVSVIVPKDSRFDWLEEWRGELAAHRRGTSGGGATSAPRGDLLFRAWGALPDALHLRHRAVALNGVASELRIVIRGLAHRPGFTAVALGTLALGIGANTALFSVVHAVLLRPLPFAEPDRLVRFWGTQGGERALSGTVSYPDVQEVGGRAGAFTSWAAFDEWRPAIARGDTPAEVVYGGTVNATFFDVLGVQPALGRFFRPDEEGEGRELRVVIGHRLWQRLGGEPGLVGGTVLVNGNPAEVIGILPAEFETPGLEGGAFGGPEVWRTVATPPEFRSGRSWGGIARLRDGLTIETAQVQVDGVTAALEAEYPEDNLGWGMALVPIRDQLLGDADEVLALLSGAVVLLLLVACANVAGLLLVRAVERRREVDVRIALGASSMRLAVVGSIESLLLAGIGAAAGVGLSVVVLNALAGRLGSVLPRLDGVAVDPVAAAFGAGLALVTGLLMGFVPALDAWRRSGRPGGARVAAGSRGGSMGPDGVRLRRALVAGQVATSVVLLVGAGVLARSLVALYDVDLGLERRGVVTATLHSAAFANLSPEEADALYASLLGRLRALPGVRAAGAINILPLSGGFSCDGVTRDDLPLPGPGEERCAEIRTILPGTLDALGIPAMRGRTTEEADHRLENPGVVLVSEEMAETFWPGEEPLGKSVTIHGDSWEVVGVVGDVRHFGPAGESRPQAYIPAQKDPWGGVSYGLGLVIRGSGDGETLAREVRRVVADENPALAITSLQALGDLLDGSVAGPRFRATLLGAFALLAVSLAMVGLGGVVAYSVRQRTREIGVRMALGASPSAVSGMVLGETLRLVLGGAGAGLCLSLLAAGLLDGMVFGVNARDPWTVSAAAILVAALGLAVSLYPARRAARVDALGALSREV